MSFFCGLVAIQVFIASCQAGTAEPKDLEARKLLSFLQVSVSKKDLLTLRCVASVCYMSSGIEAVSAAPGNLQEGTNIPSLPVISN